MKSACNLFLVAIALLVSNASTAQKASSIAKKPLPVECPDLKEKLLVIQKSFSKMEQWKKDSTRDIIDKAWTTEFVMCGQAAIVKVRKSTDDVELFFQFDRQQYAGTSAQVEEFGDKIRKGMNEVFGKTFVESYWRSDADEMYSASDIYTWKVNGSGYGEAKKRISLRYPFVESHLAISFFYIRDK